MPIEVPEVYVTDDPTVVLLFVGLFAGVLVLALIFAGARLRGEPAPRAAVPLVERDGASAVPDASSSRSNQTTTSHLGNAPDD